MPVTDMAGDLGGLGVWAAKWFVRGSIDESFLVNWAIQLDSRARIVLVV